MTIQRPRGGRLVFVVDRFVQPLDDQIQEIGHKTRARPSFVGRHALLFGAEQDSSGDSEICGSGFPGVRTSAVDIIVAGHLFRRVRAADVVQPTIGTASAR